MLFDLFRSQKQAFAPPYANAICYSGYREGQSPPSGVFPTYEQIKEDLLILDGFQTRPARMLGQQMQFLFRTLNAEAAGHDDDEIRIRRDKIVPGDPRRVLTGFAEQRSSAGQFDDFGNPVSRRHQRFEPLDADHRRSGCRLRQLCGEVLQSLLE